MGGVSVGVMNSVAVALIWPVADPAAIWAAVKLAGTIPTLAANNVVPLAGVTVNQEESEASVAGHAQFRIGDTGGQGELSNRLKFCVGGAAAPTVHANASELTEDFSTKGAGGSVKTTRLQIESVPVPTS